MNFKILISLFFANILLCSSCVSQELGLTKPIISEVISLVPEDEMGVLTEIKYFSSEKPAKEYVTKKVKDLRTGEYSERKILKSTASEIYGIRLTYDLGKCQGSKIYVFILNQGKWFLDDAIYEGEGVVCG